MVDFPKAKGGEILQNQAVSAIPIRGGHIQGGLVDQARRIRIEVLKDNLLRLRDKVVATCNDGVEPNTEGCYDIGDRGNSHHERFISTAIDNYRAKKLVMINRALSHLDQGLYGFCSNCECPIPENRLIALPFAVRCINCQEGQERK